MATDTNRFDAYLKEHLYLDIVFRIGIWLIIAISTGAYATRNVEFSGFDYFKKVAEVLLPLLNTFGSVAVGLVLIALFFKDAEYINPAKYGQATKAGRVGGFFRRLAGDISLWAIGAVISLITALSFAVLFALRSNVIKNGDLVAIAWMYAVFFGFLAVMSVLNVFARRAEPPLTGKGGFVNFLTTSNRVLFLYVCCAMFIILYIGYFGGN